MFFCTYLVGWVSIKARFELTVDISEAKVINKYYESCGLGYKTKLLQPVEASPSPSPTPTASATPTDSVTPTATPTATPIVTPSASPIPSATQVVTVSPGAFCSPAGATGKSSSGVLYTCKTSPTDARNRWRQ